MSIEHCDVMQKVRRQLREHCGESLRKKRFLATGGIFLGAAGDGAAPTVTCSGAQTPAALTNGTARTAGDTSRPYKWGLICRVAQSPAAPRVAIYRGGW